MARHHYLGALPKIGETIWYVATSREHWVAQQSITAAALKCGVRDRWIGWDFRSQYGRLKLIANNSRFLILPEWHRPNVGSRVLSCVLGIEAGAILCGMRGYKAIAEWADALGQKARERLGCRRENGRYVVPSEFIIRDCSTEIAVGLTSRTPLEASPQRLLQINRGHWAIQSVHYRIDWNYDEDRSRIRTGFGPENITRLRRFAVGILKSFQKQYQSIAAMMRKLCFNTRLVFDYLRMTENSAPALADLENKFTVA